MLLDPTARARGLYRTDAVECDLQAGEWRDKDGIWRALNIELWFRLLVEPNAAYAANESITSASRAATAS